MSSEKPFGKDATVAALLDAADALFGEKGPSAVTVREISGRANVNHALLHRHFGSKEALLDAILERHVSASKDAIRRGDQPEEKIGNLMHYLASQPAFARTFAHLILEHRPLEEFVRRTGGTAELASINTAEGVPSSQARAYAAVMMAFGLGWALFKDLTTYAASCDNASDMLDETAVAAIAGLLRQIKESQANG